MALESDKYKGVQKIYDVLIKQYGSEVDVLVDSAVNDSGVDERVIDAINAFRNGRVRVIPGGGGQYGEVELGGVAPSIAPEAQKSLFDFKEGC